MEIKTEFNNKLLHRKEIVITLESNVTPSKTDMLKQISDKYKSGEDTIVIDKIEGKFGRKDFSVSAKIYDNLEAKNKYETITRKERKKRIEEAKKAEEEKKKAEEEAKKAAEQPAEEVKEEVKE